MGIFRKLGGLTTIVVSLFASTICMAQDIPQLRGRVNDYAGVLTPAQEQTLESSLARIETIQGRPQLVILTTRDMGGKEIEEYSIKVARTWGIGQKNVDNGILITIFVAKGDDFAGRLEIGSGLEGIIPDATARAIYENTMRPHFKNEGREDYMAAFTGATQAIDQLLRGEQTGNAAIDNAVQIEKDNFKIWSVVIIGGLIAGIAGFFHLAMSGVFGAIAGAVLPFVMSWGLGSIIPFLLLGALLGFLAHGLFRVGLEGAASSDGGSFGGGGFRGGGGGFSGGGFSGGR